MRSLRFSYSIGCLFCIALLSFGFYLEYGLGQMPCLLCQLQRLTMMVMAILFLIAAAHNPQRNGRWIYSGLLLLFSLFGVYLAGRQLWLIAHPPTDLNAQCSPDLTYLISALPLSEALKIILQGTGDCAKVTWSFLSISIPGWSFISFIILSMISLRGALMESRNKK
jgi:disulfide bond formation protein DsbB